MSMTLTIPQTGQRSFAENYYWSDARKHYAFAILGDLPGRYYIDFEDASFEQDTKHGTDAVIRIRGGTIGLRLRRPFKTKKYRDLTIRSVCRGHPTEWHKMHDRDTRPRLYFYGWIGSDGSMDDWIVVDVDVFVEGGYLDSVERDIPNGDGTSFRAYPVADRTPWVIASSNADWCGDG